MTKKIHLFLTMLLCAVFGMVQAQEVTLDFTTNDWGLPESKANQLLESKTFTNSDGYTITLEGAGEGNGYYFNTQAFCGYSCKSWCLCYKTYRCRGLS